MRLGAYVVRRVVGAVAVVGVLSVVYGLARLVGVHL